MYLMIRKKLLFRLKIFCYVLFFNFLVNLHNFCLLNKVFPSNILIFDTIHGKARRLWYEYHNKYEGDETP